MSAWNVLLFYYPVQLATKEPRELVRIFRTAFIVSFISRWGTYI